MKDSEKDQLKRLVKACMLEISKLKMDLKKCQETNHECKKAEDLEHKLELKQIRVKELESHKELALELFLGRYTEAFTEKDKRIIRKKVRTLIMLEEL